MLESLPTLQYNINGITYDAANVFKRLNLTVPATETLTTMVEYGERPDQISQRLYGTPDYYWSIILANKNNPFIDPIERLGETTRTTAELEAGQDLDPRDYFIQFSRSEFDVYVDDISPATFAALGLTGNTELTDHRAVDFYKFVRPGDVIVFEPQSENVFTFGAGQQKLGPTGSTFYYPQYGQSIVPNNLLTDDIKILGVAAGDKWSAALDTSGYVHFWGVITGSNNVNFIENNYYKSSTNGYTYINGANDLVLAIRESDGGLTCFGNCGRFNSAYSGQNKFSKIAWSKGITGFGIGLSGNYDVLINGRLVDENGAEITDKWGEVLLDYDITGKHEVYLFGGLTAAMGHTQAVDFKLNGHTWAFDIACTDSSCFASYAKAPEYKPSPLAGFTSAAYLTDYNYYLHSRSDSGIYTSAQNILVEYTLNGLKNATQFVADTVFFKSYYGVFNRVLQHAKNQGAVQFDGSRYSFNWTGTTFSNLLFQTRADLLDHATPNYVRNTNLWIQSIGQVDVSGVPVWQSTVDQNQRPPAQYGTLRPGWTRSGCLITPQHFVTTAHFKTNVGDTIRFTSMNNDIVERTVIGVAGFGYDTSLLLLNAPVPTVGSDKIAVYKIWDYDDNLKYINDGRGDTVYPVMYINQYRELVLTVSGGWNKNYQTGFLYGGTVEPQNILSNYSLGGRPTYMLDSGSPVFTLQNNELVYLGPIYTFNGFYSLGAPGRDSDPGQFKQWVQEKCDNLLTAHAFGYSLPVGFYTLGAENKEARTLKYTPINCKTLFSNNKNIFYTTGKGLVNNFTRYINPNVYVDEDGNTQGPFDYWTEARDSYYYLGDNITVYFCLGPDQTFFMNLTEKVKGQRNQYGALPAYINMIASKNAIFTYIFDYRPTTTINYIKTTGSIENWSTNTITVDENKTYITPTWFKSKGEQFYSSFPNRPEDQMTDDVLLAAGDNHCVFSNKNQIPGTKRQAQFLQVISVDSPFKRIFVKDLTNKMQSFMNDDPACTRISIIRKNSNGYYDILKINNNSLRGIITSKALRIISKYWDISNLNPSNTIQWNDYLEMLKIYLYGDLETSGDLVAVKKLPFKNPVEIKYYSKDYVSQLQSDLPTILNS